MAWRFQPTFIGEIVMKVEICLIGMFFTACAVPENITLMNLRSEPDNALVLLDNNPVGRTPFNLSVAGIRPRSVNHTLTFRKEGFEDYFYTIESRYNPIEPFDFIIIFPIWLIKKLTSEDAYYWLEVPGMIVAKLKPLTRGNTESSVEERINIPKTRN